MPRVLAAFDEQGRIDPSAIETAAELLRRGRLVALPTETVYGLAANALDGDAVLRIFDAKGRPANNPLIVHISEMSWLEDLAAEWPDAAIRLSTAFWPGPLTLVVPKTRAIPDAVTAGLDSVALRFPAHPVIRAVLDACGLPLAAPSANRFTAVSPTTAAHVVQSLGDKVELVLDGGPSDVGIESTVVDVTGPMPRLLRPGGVSLAALERVVGAVEFQDRDLDAGARASPGLYSKHYAPRGLTRLVESSRLRATLASLPGDARIGVVTREASAPDDARLVAWERLGSSPEAYARRLYAALHRLDEQGATHVLLEAVPDDPAWTAVRDRLRRAAG